MRAAWLSIGVLVVVGCGEASPVSPVAPDAIDAPITVEAAPARASSPPPDVCEEARRRPPVAAPTDPRDLLFHVNRALAVPSEFPISSTSVWSPCSFDPAPSKRKDDLTCVPGAYSFRNRESLRAVAFESEAPASPSTTFDGLPVGGNGKIGFKPLIDEAAAHGHRLLLRSGFRAYAMQSATFSSWVAQELAQGRSREYALRKVGASSARAGHSEHQLGTTADLVYAQPNGVVYDGWNAETIAESSAMTWVAANAHRFGLVMSYDREHAEITQYVWEPWHYRFVGVEAADLMKRCGWTTEQYLELRYGEDPPPSLNDHPGRSARR